MCDEQVLVLANFSEYEQPVFQGLFGYYDWLPDTVRDLLSKDELSLTSEITLKPYQFHWLGLDEG